MVRASNSAMEYSKMSYRPYEATVVALADLTRNAVKANFCGPTVLDLIVFVSDYIRRAANHEGHSAYVMGPNGDDIQVNFTPGEDGSSLLAPQPVNLSDILADWADFYGGDPFWDALELSVAKAKKKVVS